MCYAAASDTHDKAQREGGVLVPTGHWKMELKTDPKPYTR